jgi:MSHA pilin protein MshD
MISGVAMPAGYSAKVTVAQDALSGIASSDSLRITVKVSGGGDSLTLEGYRTRYSPNFTP